MRIFVDCGSTLTFVTPSLCDMLRETPVNMHDLSIQGYDNFQVKKNVPVFNIRISGPKGEPGVSIIAHRSGFGVDPPNIAPPNVSEALRQFDSKFPLADRSYVGEWSAARPAILLGMNQWYKLATKDAPKDVISGITAHPTRFGWVVGGNTGPSYLPSRNQVCRSASAPEFKPMIIESAVGRNFEMTTVSRDHLSRGRRPGDI